MKAILIFALFLAFSNALYISNSWKIINNGAGNFRPTSVVFAYPPKAKQFNQIIVCGVAINDCQINSYNFQVSKGSQVWFSGTHNLPSQYVFSGANYCINHEIMIPAVAPPLFTVYFSLQNNNNHITTLEINLTVTP